MKKVFLFFACIICNSIIQAQVIKTVSITSGNLYSSLSLAERQTVTDLTIKGTIDAQDFHIMRDSMPMLENIDLSMTMITSYSGTEGTNYLVDAPYLANEVPAYAFWNNVTYEGKPSLKSIILPASDTSIQSNAFVKCGALTSISIPNSVTSISIMCFNGCAMLNNVSLPASLTYLGDNAFMDCISLDSIAIPAGVISVNYSCFSGCTALKTVVFLGSTLSLVDQCFTNCSSLQNITLPASLTSIGAFTFDGCTSLATIDIPAYVTAIPMGAFKDCSSLLKVTMPSTLTSIGDNAFNGCKKLQSFTVPISLTNIGSSAFADCSSLSGFTLPEGLLTIGNSAFIQCPGISTLSIPSTTTAIGTNAFEYSILKITVNSANATYSSLHGALYDKNKTILYYIPTNISGSFIIPQTVTTIADNVFLNCNNLSSVTIPASVSTIGTFNFTYCTINTIKVLHTTPLDLSNNSTIFLSFDFTNSTLIVPAGTKLLYTGSAIWKNFGKIFDDNATDSLVAFYLFKGTANDSTSNKNNGTVKGAVLTADRFGIANSAYSFNGVNNYISIPNSSSLNISTDKLSIASWVKVNSLNGYQQIISKAINTDDAGREFGMYLSSGNVAFETSTTNERIDVTSSNSVTNQWAFLVTIYDGVAMNEYINGVLVNSTPQSGNIISNSYDLKIGMFGDGIQNPFNGVIDDIRIYNRAISQNEIDYLYHEGGYYDTVKTITVTPGGLSTGLSDYDINHITNLTIKGTIDARDFVTMNEMPALTFLDLKSATIKSYTGQEGTNYGTLESYGADTIPQLSFYEPYSGVGNATIDTIILPLTVKSINYNAFSSCTALKSVTLPSGIVNIGESAFEDCSSLANIQLPNSITSIDRKAFSNCKLSSIILPNTLSLVDYAVFTNNRLTSIDFPPSVKEIGFNAFAFCPITSVKFPNTITVIGEQSFSYCEKLSSIELPNSITKIYPYSFSNCKALTSVTIPSSVTSISYGGFNGCEGLQKVIIPNSVTNIDEHAFDQCWKLQTADIPNSVTNIGPYAFFDCPLLQSVSIPETVTNIGEKAFAYCTGLTSITAYNTTPFDLSSNLDVFQDVNTSTCQLNIPSGSMSAYLGAVVWKNFLTINEFQYLKKTITVTAGELNTVLGADMNNVTALVLSGTIDARDFETINDSLPLLNYLDASAATIIDYNGDKGTEKGVGIVYYSANTVPKYGFDNNNSIKTIYLPNTTTKLDVASFRGTNVLLYIPASLSTLGNSAFSYAASKISVDPNSLSFSSQDDVLYNKNKTAILFCGTTKTGNFVIPSTVTTIGANTFQSCSLLTNIDIPNQVDTIAGGAFSGCTSLTTIKLPDSLKTIGAFAFGNCQFTSVVVPEGVTSIINSAFYGCNQMQTITLPKSLTFIGEDSFDGCSSLSLLKVSNPQPTDLSLFTTIFQNVNTTTCILQVPFQSKQLYTSAVNWNLFTNITESDGIALNKHIVTVDNDGTTEKLSFLSNTNWSTTINANWLHFFTSSAGSKDSSVTITIDKNTGIDREAYVVFSVNGQSDSVLISQKLECVSKPIVVGKTTVCEGDIVSLTANTTNPLMWFDDATLTNLIASGQKYEVIPTSNTSLFVVQSTTTNCTSLPTQVDIVVNTLPTISASISDNDVCAMTNITFSGYGSQITSYKWTYGVQNNIPILIYSGGTYTVTGIDANGCSASASVNLIVKPWASITPKATKPYACFNDSITLWGEGVVSYEWDNGVIDSKPFAVKKEGNYYVTGTDVNGCKSTNSIYISMYNLPTVSISVNPKDSITKGNQVTLTATGSIAVNSYIWDNGIFNNSVFTPSATHIYTVTATDYNSCKAIDSIKIIVIDSIKNITVSAGILSSLFSKTEKDYITCLTLSGNIDARDFKTMRDSLPKLQNVDLSNAIIDSYIGSLGTGSGSSNYSANEIPISAFANKTTIKSISLPYSATSIANAAFENCSNLPSLQLPQSIYKIGAEALYGTKITTFDIPTSVIIVNNATFKNCSNLESITIPKTVSAIFPDAFSYCTSLKNINIYAQTPPTLTSDAITGIDKSTCKVLVPVGSLNAYKVAQGWKDFFSIEEFDTSHAPHFISGEIPQQYTMNGAMFYPIDFHQYITDEYTSIENLKFTIGQNDVMSFSMIQRMLIPKQIDSTWSGSTTLKITVTNDANLSFDFDIVFTQPFLLLAPTVKPSCSFYASKMFLKLNQPTKFYATNKNTESVEWTFDGGTPNTSTSATPTVSYDSTGLYSVTLKAINSIGDTIVSKTGYIFVSALSVGDTTICKGDSIVITALGTGFSQYTWNTSPATNAQSIKVSPKKTTIYKLTMKKGLATIIDSVTISIGKQPELGNDTTFCDGGLRILNPGTFSKYYWNGSTVSGNATITVTTAGKINVITVDAQGCSETDSVTIGTLYPKPMVNLGKDSTFCWKKKLLLDAGNTGATYKWNTGLTTKTIIADTSKAYSVTVTDSKNCTNSDTINIKVIVPIVPQIGVITQSSTNKNIVAWEPINNKGIKLYHIWRQNNANVFEVIKTVLKQDSTYYIDNTSTPKVMSYRYALTTVDSACSNESNFSVVHGSVHLKCTMQADNKTINATWTNYEGIAVSKYILSRAEKGKPLQFLATVNADNENFTSFPDGNSLGLNSYYQVSFDLPNTITPSKLKSDSGPFSLSLSNMAESELTEDAITIEESIHISPNPATDITTIAVSENKPFTATLIDVLGHSILSQNGSGSIQIDCSQLKAGIYIVKILLNEKVITSRLVVE